MKNNLSKYYLYRFLDKENNILYIGKTNMLKLRINSHRWNKQETWIQYSDKVEYCKLKSNYEMNILEIHNISKYKPPYNKNYKEYDIKLFDLPECNWKPFYIDFGYRGVDKSNNKPKDKKIYAIDIMIQQIKDIKLKESPCLMTKGKFFSRNEILNSLSHTRRSELWNSPQIQQLIEDKTLKLSGRMIEFL